MDSKDLSRKTSTAIFKALQSFKSEVPIICKDTQGFGYTYADLPKIITTITPLLKKHGLDYFQTEEEGYLKTMIIHVETGRTLESKVSIPEGVQLKGMNDLQARGSALTYFRRYSLSLALGLVTDKDTDAAGELQQSNKQTPKPALTTDSELNILEGIVMNPDNDPQLSVFGLELKNRLKSLAIVEVKNMLVYDYFKLKKTIKSNKNE